MNDSAFFKKIYVAPQGNWTCMEQQESHKNIMRNTIDSHEKSLSTVHFPLLVHPAKSCWLSTLSHWGGVQCLSFSSFFVDFFVEWRRLLYWQGREPLRSAQTNAFLIWDAITTIPFNKVNDYETPRPLLDRVYPENTCVGHLLDACRGGMLVILREAERKAGCGARQYQNTVDWVWGYLSFKHQQAWAVQSCHIIADDR